MEFGSDTSGMNWRPLAASWIQEGGGHGRQEPRREHGPNPGALVGAAQFQDPGEAESHVEETDREDRENGFITTR